MGEGFHDVSLVVTGQAGELLLRSKVYLARASGHCDGCDVLILGSGVLVVGCGIPVSSRGGRVTG